MSKESNTVIVPSHQELSVVHNNLSCSEPNCQSTFKSSSNLMMHMVKHHKKMNGLDKKLSSQYACPVEDCRHNFSSSKYFTKLKFLKQHYLKCHVVKKFICRVCLKGFSTEAFLKSHTKSCGKKFICSCSWEYTSREALMTHCRRKSHAPAGNCITNEDDKKSEDTDVQGKSNAEENTLLQVCIASPPLSHKSPRKPSNDFTVFPTHYVAAIALSELSTTFIIPKNCHIGVQTVETKQIRKCRSSDKKRKSSQETQTAGSASNTKKQKISAETQTSGHLKHKPGCGKMHRSRKRSTETQTKDQMPFLTSVNNESLDCGIFNESSLSNSSINNDTLRKPDLPTSMDDDSVWGNNSYGVKTNPETRLVTAINSQMFNLNRGTKIEPHGRMPLENFDHFDKLCNNETQTEIDSLFQPEGEGTSTTETQTTDDLIEDLYSNMCTQTCSDASDLFDFNFVDIETQTAWPDL